MIFERSPTGLIAYKNEHHNQIQLFHDFTKESYEYASSANSQEAISIRRKKRWANASTVLQQMKTTLRVGCDGIVFLFL